MPAPTWRDGAQWLKDPKLREFATPRQREFIDAVLEHGSMREAGRALGVDNAVLSRALKCARDRAAVMGYSPEHDLTHAVAPGYTGKGHSTLYGRDGKPVLQWVKTKADEDARELMFLARVEGLKDELPKAEPLAAPHAVEEDLITVYPQGDPHAGLYAWSAEVGEGFDLAEFERINRGAIDHLVASAPSSAEALYIDLGDTLHADDGKNRTPGSGHPLDVHGRHSEVMRVAMRLKRYQIARMLERHGRLTVRVNPGNHDPQSALSLALMLEAVYETEPRVEIVTSPNRYWYKGFGANLFGTTHGDGAKGKDLPLIMATDVPQLWGAAEARVWFVGHVHHKDIKDYQGVTVEYTRTLAGQDAWSHGAGFRSKRTMEAITYHRTDGEVARSTVGLRQINRAAA